jgi:hypothetical protein
MSPIQAVGVGVRLFAIWLAIHCAGLTRPLYTWARDADDPGAGLLVAAILAVCVGAVLFLWFFPRTVARSLLPAGDTVASTIDSEALFAVGCTLLGLWQVTEALPALVRNLLALAWVQRANMSVPEGWGAGTVYNVVKLAIAVWLMFGASGLRSILGWARSAGSRPHERDDPPG